jgi:hypothetical protein
MVNNRNWINIGKVNSNRRYIMILVDKIGGFGHSVSSFAYKVICAVKGAGEYISKYPVKAAIVGFVVLSFTGCLDFLTPDSPPVEDTTAPVITLQGDNPQSGYVEDPYIESGATAFDDVDGDVSSNVVIDSSTVDTSNVGSYVVEYDVSDTAGNPATGLERTVNVDWEPGLEEIANTETLMDHPTEPRKMTALEAYESLGGVLNRGTNDNVADNIEGLYDVAGSWESSTGATNTYSFSGEISNQDGFLVDITNYPDSVLTGNVDDKITMSSLKDIYGDSLNDIARFRDVNILPLGVLNAEEIRIYLTEDGGGRRWVRYIETWTLK